MEADFYKRIFLSTLIVFFVAISLFVLYQSSFIFLSALIGLGIASLVSPLIDKILKRYHVSRFLTAFSLLSVIIFFIALSFYLTSSILMGQIESLRDSLPGILEQWQKYWGSFETRFPWLANILSRSEPAGVTERLINFLQEVFRVSTTTITGLTLAVVIALYATANSKKYYKACIEIFPKKYRESVKSNANKSAKVLRKWFAAQALDMVVVGLLTTVGLWLAGINFWALYGLLAGLLSIIPYVGLIITVLLSGVVVAVEQPERLIWLLVVFGVTQNLEGNFILPKIMKDKIQIPAALLIFVMILMGMWLGILGVFVTPPILAIVLDYYRRELKDTY